MRLLGRRQDRRSRQPTQMAGLGETADGAEGGFNLGVTQVPVMAMATMISG